MADDSTEDSSQALEDAIRVERMALDNGSGVDKNLGALAREIRRVSVREKARSVLNEIRG